VFDAKLPSHIRELAVKCGRVLGKDHEAWVIAIDAMINLGDKYKVEDDLIKQELDRAAAEFETVQRVKKDDSRLRDFPDWNTKLEAAFKTYKNTEPYAKVKGTIESSIERNKQDVVFHEANSCPEFWEHTRLIAGINVAIPLLKGAQSLL
jgi:methionine aminopeptidase